MTTTLKQARSEGYISGSVEYFTVESYITETTHLPHVFVFVYTLKNRVDPKDDVFTRVARISDLTTLAKGRNAALLAHEGTNFEFLQAASTVQYTVYDEAAAGAIAIRDRVNKLVEDWVDFNSGWRAPDPTPGIYTLPYVMPTQVGALIAAYRMAKEARYQASLEKEAADTDLSNANDVYTAAAAHVTAFTAFIASALVVKNETPALRAWLSTLVSAGNSFASAITTPDAGETTAKSVFLTAVVAATGQDILAATHVSDSAALHTALNAYLTLTLTPAAAAASAQLIAAQAAAATKLQARTSATALEATTLAAVLAVCPDFESDSICLLPSD